METETFVLYGILIVTSVFVSEVKGNIQYVRDICCDIGTFWAGENDYCGVYPNKIDEINEEQERMCQAMIKVCCLKSHQAKMCEAGKEDGRNLNAVCTIRPDVIGSDAYRECCQCCEMGQEAKFLGLGCEVPNVGSPCDTAFRECCLGANVTVPPTDPSAIDDIDECAAFGGNICSHTCVNTVGSFYCECRDGYSLAQDRRTCIETPQKCREGMCSHFCADSPRGPICRCRNGYILNEDQRTCRDIDECETGQHNCRYNEICVNTDGRFVCFPNAPDTPTCRQGYIYNEASRGCVKKEPEQPCDSGFAYNTITATCEDIDECIVQMDNCNSTIEICYNTFGSFRCRCKNGYRRNRVTDLCEDIDECALNMNTCTSSQRCENTEGSYTCRRLTPCGTGWTLDEDTQQCVDQNECEINTHNCVSGYECFNIEGSFRCIPKSCPTGQRFSASSGRCENVTCPSGLRAEVGSTCADIDECKDPKACEPFQTCENNYGSFRCIDPFDCRPGFKVGADVNGLSCVDINECDIGDHDCTGESKCINFPGGFRCSCPEGYARINKACVDKNECQYSHNCPADSTCENTIGSFRCICNPGLEQRGKQCIDIDECRGPNPCQQRCVNTVGSYHCACNTGYTLTRNKTSCEDRDECKIFSRRGGLCAGACINTPGSYRCTCPDGWKVLGNGRSCQDVNECRETPNICGYSPDVMCFNTRGSYKCPRIVCPAGFSRSAFGPRRNSEVVVEADDILCKKDCDYWDLECLHNETSSVSYQFLALPIISEVKQPVVLLNITAKGFILVPQMFLHIISGNEDGQFETEVSGDNAVLRLTKPLSGPKEYRLMLRLENRSYVRNRVISAHNTHLTIDVSDLEF